jgi:hypothetical protein
MRNAVNKRRMRAPLTRRRRNILLDIRQGVKEGGRGLKRDVFFELEGR